MAARSMPSGPSRSPDEPAGPTGAPAASSGRRAAHARRELLLVAVLCFAGSAASAAPPLRITRMTLVSTTGAVTELLVEAEHAVVDIEANRADLEGVRAEWTQADGTPSLELTCERGEFNLSTNDLLAVGDVRGHLRDGRRFEGAWLRYDRAKGVAFTDAPVTILDQGRLLRGGGLRYHVRNGRLRLTAGASFVETP